MNILIVLLDLTLHCKSWHCIILLPTLLLFQLNLDIWNFMKLFLIKIIWGEIFTVWYYSTSRGVDQGFYSACNIWLLYTIFFTPPSYTVSRNDYPILIWHVHFLTFNSNWHFLDLKIFFFIDLSLGFELISGLNIVSTRNIDFFISKNYLLILYWLLFNVLSEIKLFVMD